MKIYQGRCFLVLLAGLLLTGGTPPAQAQVLKVLALNFNSETVAFDDRKELIRDLRFAAMVEYIRTEQPDIILLAEAWNYRGAPSVGTPLAREIGYDSYYKLGEGFPGLLYDSNVVLARREFRMERRQTTTLPHSAPHIGDRVNWIIPFGAISQAVGARLTLNDGSPLYVAATHLLGEKDSQHEDQIRAVDRMFRKQARKQGVDFARAYVLFGGDFNSAPDSRQIRAAGSLGYVDTFAAAHPDHALDTAGATDCSDPYSPLYNPLTLGAGQLPGQSDLGTNGRIDYIMARGPRVRTLASTVVFKEPIGGFWMSDHFGVLSTVEVGGGDAFPVPNPLTDADGHAPLGPTRVLEVTDRDFAPCDDQVDCELALPAQPVAGARGLALVNRGSAKIYAKLSGPGRVLPSAHTSLKPGQASSFVFMAPGEYTLAVQSPEGDVLRAPVHVAAAVGGRP